MRRQKWVRAHSYRISILAYDAQKSTQCRTQTCTVVFTPAMATVSGPDVGHRPQTMIIP